MLIPAIDLSGTSAVTVTLWANRTYSTIGRHALFEATSNYANSVTGFGFFPDDADCNGIQAALHGDLGYTANCYCQPSSGVWHHLAVVFDKSQTGGEEIKFYVDGVLQTANQSLSASTNTNRFGNNLIYLFSRAGITEFTSGMIGDLRIYGSALTAEQIQQIYSNAELGSVSLALSGSGWQQGFDFRNTSTFVTDPSGDTYVLPTTAYPTKGSGVTYGWVKTSLVSARDRNAQLDPRLAGINYATNGSPATFYVDLPSPGTYSLSLAMGDDGYQQCYTQCQIQFLDGTTVLATVSKGLTRLGYFYDVTGNNWSAVQWPSNNVSQQVTLAGTRLTVVVGMSQSNGDITPLAFLGVAQVRVRRTSRSRPRRLR